MALSLASCQRNTAPILEQLRRLWPTSAAKALEVASGSGEHTKAFAAAFPHIVFQPSEITGATAEMASIDAHCGELPNVRSAVTIDIQCEEHFTKLLDDDDAPYDIAFGANFLHYSEKRTSQLFFKHLSPCLVEKGAILTVYGPFLVDGKFTTESNEKFDKGFLKSKNPEFGLRDIGWLADLARRDAQMTLDETIEMPANNFLLVFRR